MAAKPIGALTSLAFPARDHLPMIPRFTMLLLLLLGVALGPVRSVAGCGERPGAVACHACCADPATACCAAADAPPISPARTAQTADEGQPLVAPVLAVIALSPAPVQGLRAVQRRKAARLPVVARLDLICVRLI